METIQPQNRDPESGPSGALKHLNSWLRHTSPTSSSPSTSLGYVAGAMRRTPLEPPPESELSVVSHVIGAKGEDIVIDLGHNSFVNLISMQLWDKESR